MYFSLPTDVRARCRVLDLDEALGESEPGFVRYDFNRPTELPESLRNAFAMVVIDPPYITEDVWRQYVATAKWLLDGDAGRVLCTTVIENAPLLKSALGAQPNVYLPSIPQLPYQYAAYTNYAAPALQVRNLEVAHDPDELLSAAPPTSAAGGGSGASVAAAEAPIRGSGPGGYDFEAMIEAELRRSAAQAPPAPQ